MLQPLTHSDQTRRMMLKSLLWVTLCFGLLFVVFNTSRGHWLIAGVELAYALVSLALLLTVDRAANLRVLTLVYLVPFCAVILFTVASPHTSVGIFAWIQTIPITLYLLLGLRMGLVGSLLIGSLGLYLFSQHYAQKSLDDELGFFLDIGMATLGIAVFSHTYERARSLAEQRLIQLATTDSLTGLTNRTKLSEVFQREHGHARRHGRPLALVYLDIDHFKQINDRFGHEAGDLALRHFANTLSQQLRSTDLLCRLGGEEFAALLPDTNAEQAWTIAESLRERLASHPLQLQNVQYSMTLSAGVAVLGADGSHLDELMNSADRRTYAAKHAGRNRVIRADTGTLCG